MGIYPPPKTTRTVEGGTGPSGSCASDNLLVLAFGRTRSSLKGQWSIESMQLCFCHTERIEGFPLQSMFAIYRGITTI